MAGNARILALRALLAEKFPAVPTKAGARLATGNAALDEVLGGGLSRMGLTELCSASPSSGAGLVLSLLLETMARTNQHMALVDGSDTFDPQAYSDTILRHLLWVRCESVAQALKAADLLLRDGNLPLVVMDLRLGDERQLRKIPSTTWYKYQRVAEQGTTALAILTSQTLVNSAEARIRLGGEFSLNDLEGESAELVRKLEIEVVRSQSLGSHQEEAV